MTSYAEAHDTARASFPVLDITADQELELIKTYQNPASSAQARADALDKLTRAHIRFIHKIAVHMHRLRGHPIDDLLSEGWLGFLHAITKYDPARGYRLMTYAGPWVRQYMQRFGYSDTTIRLPDHVYERKQADQHPQPIRLDTYPADRSPHIRIDHDARPVDQTAIARALSEDVRRALACLNDRERWIICLRFGIGTKPHSLKDAGAQLGVTRGRIGQLEKQAMANLRQLLEVGYQCDSL